MATPVVFAAIFAATSTAADTATSTAASTQTSSATNERPAEPAMPAVLPTAPPPPATDGPVPIIELITMAPGAQLYTLWGHAAIRVTYPGRDTVYNFGSIDFSRGFLFRMLRGQVDAFVGLSSFARTYRVYRAENRTIERRRLRLPPAVAQAVAADLAARVDKDRGAYRYHHFDDNCSTQVADVLDKALGGRWSASYQTKRTDETFRSHALRLVRDQAFLYVGIDIVMSGAVDRPLNAWDTRFLPEHLIQLADDVRMDGGPLVAERIVAFESQMPHKAPGTWPWAKVYLLFMAPLLAMMIRWPRAGSAVWLAIAGSLGAAVALLWVGTNYDFLRNNWNLAVLPPTHLIAAVLLTRASLWCRPSFRLAIRIYAGVHALGLVALAIALGTDQLAQQIGPVLGLALGPGVVMAARLKKPKNGHRFRG